MTPTYSLAFSSPPSLWALYSRILLARKPAHVPEGRAVPRIEARLSRVQVDTAHLQRYRDICGDAGSGVLPLAYPHVLASALHLAMLSSERFPVALLGLVHVANRIEVHGALDPAAGGEIACWLEGHEDTPRGQQFALNTEWITAAGTLWREQCTFLARAKRPVSDGGRRGRDSTVAAVTASGPAAAHASADTSAEPVSTTSFRAPVGLGRRYGQVSGDVNPIHLADVTAKAFGFRAAIAHGMWSLARCAAELDDAQPAEAPRVLDVQFRLPVFLPSWLSLQHGRQGDAVRFALLDSQGEKTHLTGSLRRLA